MLFPVCDNRGKASATQKNAAPERSTAILADWHNRSTANSIEEFEQNALPTGMSQPLVMNVKISASNHQLEASGVTATNVLLTREATKLAEKRKAEASKRAAPKF